VFQGRRNYSIQDELHARTHAPQEFLRRTRARLAPQPRWTIPINIRSQDKPIMDALLEIAVNNRSDITNVVRSALAEYVKRLGSGGESQATSKVDHYLDSPFAVTKILTPGELNQWTDSDVLALAKVIRARQQELEFELRRRGYRFSW